MSVSIRKTGVVNVETVSETYTGSIVTFNSQYAGLPLKSCKVAIPVTQEGTGDPSPDNVRNFVGIDSLDFSATGKNLLRMNKSTATDTGVTFTVNEDFSITTSGEYQGRTGIFITSYLVTLRAGTYTFTGCPSGGSYSDYVLRLENSSNVLIALDTGNGRTFTLTEDQPVYCRIYIYSQNGVGKTFYPMVRLVDSNSDYEPFGDNKLFTFGQTIYAGELDVLTGIFTATHGIVTYDSNNMPYMQIATISGGVKTRVFIRQSGVSQDISGVPDMFCNIAEPVEVNAQYTGVEGISIRVNANVNNQGFYIYNEDLQTLTDWQDYINNNSITVVYPLATPEVINLGGMEISTLQGENNLFASTGETTLTTYTNGFNEINAVRASIAEEYINSTEFIEI